MAAGKLLHHRRLEISFKINYLYFLFKVEYYSCKGQFEYMITSGYTRIFLMLTALCLSSGFVMAQKGAANADLDAANALAAILQETKTLQAQVEVLTLDQDGREIQESVARLIMEKPYKVSWEIMSPYQELMLTDGSRIWRYEHDLEQVSIDAFNNDISRTPVLLLNGEAAAIADSYNIASAAMDYGSVQRFILTPKAPDSLFERLSLSFVDSTLTEMQFEDSLGQKTSLTFSNVRANEAIDPAVFIFQMPADVDNLEVIDNTGF